VEKFLLEASGGGSFTVVGDHEQTMVQLRLLAARHGWSCDIERAGPHEWRASFRPSSMGLR
jgi:hypothetical protein